MWTCEMKKLEGTWTGQDTEKHVISAVRNDGNSWWKKFISSNFTSSKHNFVNFCLLFSSDNGSMSTISSGQQNQQAFEVSNQFFPAQPLFVPPHCFILLSEIPKIVYMDVFADLVPNMMELILGFPLLLLRLTTVSLCIVIHISWRGCFKFPQGWVTFLVQ